MTYEEACEAKVTRAQALREIRRHDCDWDEFVSEYGDKETYAGEDVLNWLGY